MFMVVRMSECRISFLWTPVRVFHDASYQSQARLLAVAVTK